MRIITVNLPIPYLQAISKLVGEKSLYPSRSELVRVAVREFLIKELEAAQSFADFNSRLADFNSRLEEGEKNGEKKDDSSFVRVPTDPTDPTDPTAYKTFRIVKK